MGLFTQKPQEPSAWAALPGEPLDDDNPANRLADPPPTDLLDLGVGGQSVTVTVAITAEPAEADAADS